MIETTTPPAVKIGGCKYQSTFKRLAQPLKGSVKACTKQVGGDAINYELSNIGFV